jgi:ligand-binding sensor domain-containing protein
VNRRYWIGLGAAAGVGAIYSGAALWRAKESEERAASVLARIQMVAATDRWRDAPPPSGFEPLPTPADFRAATGRFIAAANGLLAWNPDGTIAEQWRCGWELPPAPLTALVQVGDVLWIATEGEGVLALEGGKLRHIRPVVKTYGTVRALLPVASGAMLWGTDTGVLRSDGKGLNIAHPALARIAVTALAGKEEDLYIGTRANGLWRWHAGQLDQFGEAEGLPDPHVQTVAVTEDSVVAGTPVGAALFRGGKFERKLAEGFFVRSALIDGETLYAGTLEDGLVTTPLGARGRAVVTGKQEIRQVVSPSRLLTRRELLVVEHGREETLVAAPAGLLTDGNVSALAMDGAGRLWVGYFDRGLDILGTDGKVSHFENDRLFCVNRIVHAPDRTAVATANGLLYFDAAGRQRQVVTREDGLIATHVTDVLLAESAVLAATPAGLTIFDRSGARSLNAFHGLGNNHLYSLARRGEEIFCGTLGGITRIQQGVVRVSHSTANSGLRANWVTAMAVAGGDVYVGTYGGGVQRLDGNNAWQDYKDLPADVVVNPGAMMATAAGVYAGTLKHGLLCFDRARLRWRQITDGLPSANVTALAWANGSLYAGTDNGLVKIAEGVLHV